MKTIFSAFVNFSWPMKTIFSTFVNFSWPMKTTPPNFMVQMDAMKPEISVFMAIKNAFIGFSRHFHGIFMKKKFIVYPKLELPVV